MNESYRQMLSALRDGAALVHLDVQAPRSAPTKQIIASLFTPAPGRRPQGQAISLAVTTEQATELLAAGAEWKGPSHIRDEVLPSIAS